jgi:hypothetical protein
MMIRTKQKSSKSRIIVNSKKLSKSKTFNKKDMSYSTMSNSSKEFDIVGLVYPNEWRNNTEELYSKSKRKLEPFNWFICSYRMYDYENEMYYSSVSPDVHFYSSETGKTLTARGGLSKREGERYRKPVVASVDRARLLILSDPHNKKMLCKQFGYMCGCNSKRDVLSTECHLTINSGEALIKGAQYAIKLGYDGVVIQHDCMESDLDTSDAIICQNATFVFRKSILETMDESSQSDRCGIVKYSKKHNSCIRKVIPKFPTTREIDDLLEDNNCSIVSVIMYDIVKMYMKKRNKL